MELSRRSFVGGIAALGAGSLLPRFSFAGQRRGFRIAFLSDVHAPECRTFSALLKETAEAINRTNPNLVVFLGDHFYSSFGTKNESCFKRQSERFDFLRSSLAAPSILTSSEGEISDFEADPGSWKLRFTEDTGHIAAGPREVVIRHGDARERAENYYVLPYEPEVSQEFPFTGPLQVSGGSHRHSLSGSHLRVGSVSGDWWFGNAPRSFAVVDLLEDGRIETSEKVVS